MHHNNNNNNKTTTTTTTKTTPKIIIIFFSVIIYQSSVVWASKNGLKLLCRQQILSLYLTVQYLFRVRRHERTTIGLCKENRAGKA